MQTSLNRRAARLLILALLVGAALYVGGLAATAMSAGPMTDSEARSAIAATSNDTAPDGMAGYMVEETFADHLGADVDRLCDWVDRKLEAPGALDSGQAAIRALSEAKGGAGGDGVPIVLLAVCGYYGDAETIAASWERQKEWILANPHGVSKSVEIELENTRLDWFYLPPYPFGDVDQAPVTFSPWQS